MDNYFPIFASNDLSSVVLSAQKLWNSDAFQWLDGSPFIPNIVYIFCFVHRGGGEFLYYKSLFLANGAMRLSVKTSAGQMVAALH